MIVTHELRTVIVLKTEQFGFTNTIYDEAEAKTRNYQASFQII